LLATLEAGGGVTCSDLDCDRQTYARGFCFYHYKKALKSGLPVRQIKKRPLEDRFLDKVEKQPDGCWLWTGCRDAGGYGRLGLNNRTVSAHITSYREIAGRQIPPGLTLDHLCRRPNCVNPDHLEPVTQQENNLRGNGWAGRNAAVTHCPRGHAYDEANTRWRKNGRRLCRTCKRDGERIARARKREATA
jgi:hypothetical protein